MAVFKSKTDGRILPAIANEDKYRQAGNWEFTSEADPLFNVPLKYLKAGTSLWLPVEMSQAEKDAVDACTEADKTAKKAWLDQRLTEVLSESSVNNHKCDIWGQLNAANGIYDNDTCTGLKQLVKDLRVIRDGKKAQVDPCTTKAQLEAIIW